MKRIFVHEHLSAQADAGAELRAAGQAMRHAVVRDLLALPQVTVSVTTGPDDPVPAGARPVRMPPGQGAAAFVAEQALMHDAAWVIAPETDGVLAQLQQAVQAAPGALWLGCDGAAIAVASSKRATLAHAAELGLSTPLAFAALPCTRRWVVKPDDGAGAMATCVHPTLAAARDDAATRRQRGESAELEAWVAGEPLSLSLLCTPGRVELLSVNRQQVTVDALGRLQFEGVVIDVMPQGDARFGQLCDWAGRVVAALPGLRGFVGIDLVWHALRGPVLIEVNPRVTEAYVGLSARLGRNLAAAVLACHQPEPAHDPG